MTVRMEGGFWRTTCTCATCVTNCKTFSGMVSVTDILRWQAEQGAGFSLWALTHLAASPGAIVVFKGEVMRIPTLVPRRLDSGQCHWLDENDRCSVHETSPYGCAFYDCTMTKADGDQRSQFALMMILYDHLCEGPYSQTWHRLHAIGQTAEAPEAVRWKKRRRP